MTSSVAELRSAPARPEVAAAPGRCYHCGDHCRRGALSHADKIFCCAGCQTVFELLTDNGLQDFYSLAPAAGVKIKARSKVADYDFLDEPSVRRRVVDFADDHLTRVRFRTPTIHCAACIWLLENLFRLRPGIAASRVNFGKKEVSLSFAHDEIQLSEVAHLLASLGYAPDLNFADLHRPSPNRHSNRLPLQLGVAGFAFGNIMLFGISSYLGLDETNAPGLRKFFGFTSLALAVPVLLYSASDYWKSAWISIKGRFLTIEVPIALGLIAFFLRSLHDVLGGGGLGFLDSLTGLIFFLLCGKWFQQKTFNRLEFNRDYRSFFPLSVTRRGPRGAEERVALSQIETGDHLLIKNGEIIPADASLVSGEGLIDYSFVTGESAPAARQAGDHLYAGGRQCGAAIEVVTVKGVSQSYLTSLWGQRVFQKAGRRSFVSSIDRFSRWFTVIILGVAAGAGAYWMAYNPSLALPAAMSVLIVACPCALALAAPFGLGAAQRILAGRGLFLKSPQVIETLAQADVIVFDKTGTLSAPGAHGVQFIGQPLSLEESGWIRALTRQSAHPAATRIGEWLSQCYGGEPLFGEADVCGFNETPGGGVEAAIDGHEIHLGSPHWLRQQGLDLTATEAGAVELAIDRSHRGSFKLAHGIRPEVAGLLQSLAGRYELALLSGDTDRERRVFEPLFDPRASLRFQQSPMDKLQFIHARQEEGKIVVMVGDGLNDAGALRQSDVGVAVMETLNGFSPASDVIMTSASMAQLPAALRFSRATMRAVRVAFGISAVYNVVGLSIAAHGILSPLTCAILMPLSSISVVAFTCGAAYALARWSGLSNKHCELPSGRAQ
jgi:Cu+-exporting ATPase